MSSVLHTDNSPGTDKLCDTFAQTIYLNKVSNSNKFAPTPASIMRQKSLKDLIVRAKSQLKANKSKA